MMPTSNSINANDTGLVRYDGAGNFDAQTTTDHAVLIGAPSNGINSILLTNGQLPIGSTGADPVAANLVSLNGSISIVNGPGSINIQTTGAGTGGFTSIVIQTFIASGTYTPSVGMLYAIVEVIGGGGGGGGTTVGGGGGIANDQGAGGGGGGGYARAALSAGAIGASAAIVVGAGGAGGSNTGGNGGTGGSSTFASPILVSATGGNGGTGLVHVVGSQPNVLGGEGGIGNVGLVMSTGSPGGAGVVCSPTLPKVPSGEGGSSTFGGGGRVILRNISGSAVPGDPGRAYGGGGSGAFGEASSPSGAAGGNGASGVVIITEYIA